MTSAPPPPPDQPPLPPPPPPGSSRVPVPAGGGGGYPVVLDFRRGLEVERWRPLVNWLLAIPHFVVLYVLGIAAFFLWIASFFTILFTRRNPFVNFQAMWLRYTWRVTSFAMFMRDEYPPFDFGTEPAAVVDDTAVVTVVDPGEMNRWLVLVKWLLAIPHFIVLWLLSIGVFVVWVIAFFAVVFTGA